MTAIFYLSGPNSICADIFPVYFPRNAHVVAHFFQFPLVIPRFFSGVSKARVGVQLRDQGEAPSVPLLGLRREEAGSRGSTRTTVMPTPTMFSLR